MTNDLSLVYFVYQTGDIGIFDLRSYSTQFPSMVIKTGQETTVKCIARSDVLHTCQYGDLPWKERLQHLHSEETTLTSQSATRVDSHVAGQKKHARVSGFKGGKHAKVF